MHCLSYFNLPLKREFLTILMYLKRSIRCIVIKLQQTVQSPDCFFKENDYITAIYFCFDHKLLKFCSKLTGHSTVFVENGYITLFRLHFHPYYNHNRIKLRLCNRFLRKRSNIWAVYCICLTIVIWSIIWYFVKDFQQIVQSFNLFFFKNGCITVI